MSCIKVCATEGFTLSPANSNIRTTVRTYHVVEGANFSAHFGNVKKRITNMRDKKEKIVNKEKSGKYDYNNGMEKNSKN